jgi:hypothetical protein
MKKLRLVAVALISLIFFSSAFIYANTIAKNHNSAEDTPSHSLIEPVDSYMNLIHYLPYNFSIKSEEAQPTPEDIQKMQDFLNFNAGKYPINLNEENYSFKSFTITNLASKKSITLYKVLDKKTSYTRIPLLAFKDDENMMYFMGGLTYGSSSGWRVDGNALHELTNDDGFVAGEDYFNNIFLDYQIAIDRNLMNLESEGDLSYQLSLMFSSYLWFVKINR